MASARAHSRTRAPGYGAALIGYTPSAKLEGPSRAMQYHWNDLTALVSSRYTTAMGFTWDGW